MFAKRNLRAALMAPLLVSLILGSVESALASNTSTSRTTIRDAVVSTRITAHQVTFKVDGSTRQLSTNARTVGEAMKEALVTLGPLDLVSTPLAASIKQNLQVRVTRIKVTHTIKKSKIAIPVEKIKNAKMLVGKTIIKAKGAPGLKEVDAVTTYADGKVSSVETKRSTILTAPVTKVVVVGTRPRTVDELNWRAVANCESHGNPRSSDSKYGYYGMYQFSLTAWKTAGGTGNPMDASAAEQTMRAKRLFKIRGAGAWPYCGRFFYR